MAVTFACPLCGAVSHHPTDARERYCGHCHVFVDDEPVASALRLVGKRVMWAHQVQTARTFDGSLQRELRADHGWPDILEVERATAHGLVTLKGWSGAFAPQLFVVVEETPRV